MAIPPGLVAGGSTRSFDVASGTLQSGKRPKSSLITRMMRRGKRNSSACYRTQLEFVWRTPTKHESDEVILCSDAAKAPKRPLIPKLNPKCPTWTEILTFTTITLYRIPRKDLEYEDWSINRIEPSSTFYRPKKTRQIPFAPDIPEHSHECPICLWDFQIGWKLARCTDANDKEVCPHVFCRDCLEKAQIKQPKATATPISNAQKTHLCPYCRMPYVRPGSGLVIEMPREDSLIKKPLKKGWNKMKRAPGLRQIVRGWVEMQYKLARWRERAKKEKPGGVDSLESSLLGDSPQSGLSVLELLEMLTRVNARTDRREVLLQGGTSPVVLEAQT